MSQFTTPFKGELIGKNKWKTIESFEYHIGTYPSNEVIKVPAGFVTDFASVPRIFWSIISPVDNHGKAAVIHDYCYQYGIYSRKKSDLIFKEGMKVLGTSKLKRYLMYKAVRLFAWSTWNKSRKQQKQGKI